MQINNSIEFEFYKNYAEKVAPVLEEFEKERRKLFGIFILAAVFFCVIGLIAPIIYKNNITVLKIVIICVILVILTAFGMNKIFCQEIKENCMPALISVFGDIGWMPHRLLSDYSIINSELFGEYNTQLTDDCFYGKYKDVDFYISETSLMVLGCRKGFIFYPVFKGIVITFLSNKPVINKTVVTTKGDINVRNCKPIGLLLTILTLGMTAWSFLLEMSESEHILFAVMLCIMAALEIIWTFEISNPVTRLLFNFQTRERLDKMTLEDPEFERKYNAYSSDQIEGRYLLTTSFMERFKNLHTAFGSRRAKCSFYDGNKLMIAISTNRNLFEIGNSFSPINNIKRINVFLKEIQSVYDMIDYFKLDQHTGL